MDTKKIEKNPLPTTGIVPPDQEHINMFIIYSKYASFQRNSTEFGLIISQMYL
jgi:hypothetical protein